jgi:ABC-type uncharacterized transport system permease subunit
MLESAAERPAATPSLTSYNAGAETLRRFRTGSEFVVIPLLAITVAALLFAVFLLSLGKSPVDFVSLIWKGGFGSAFSIQNSLQRSSPLIL